MNISIDLETFSDVDISKGGVYRYAESDNFEILLFAYAVDGGEVVVVDMAQGEKIPENIVEEWKNRISLRRPGQPEDVAKVALFLASDLSSYVTGQVINCCGGMIG